MRIIYHYRTQLDDAQGVHVRSMVRAFQELGHEVDVVCWRSFSSNGLAPAAVALRPTACLRRSTRASACSTMFSATTGWHAHYAANGRPDLRTLCAQHVLRRAGEPALRRAAAARGQYALARPAALAGAIAFPPTCPPSRARVCSSSTQTIVVSDALRQLLVREGAPEDRLTVMHNAVDPAVFDPTVSGRRCAANTAWTMAWSPDSSAGCAIGTAWRTWSTPSVHPNSWHGGFVC